jgi:hypothetical protein
LSKDFKYPKMQQIVDILAECHQIGNVAAVEPIA